MTLINIYLTNIFISKMSSAFTSATCIQVHFRLDFIMQANTMNPDQTVGAFLPWGYKTFSMLNSAEHEIYPAHKS